MGSENPMIKQRNTYRIEYLVEEPSKFSDYDYDPNRPNRRFISTYIHQLIIYDDIINQEILKLHFSSDSCAQMLQGLYLALNTRYRVITIHNIYTEYEGNPSVPITCLVVRDDEDDELFHLNIRFIDVDLSFPFTEEQLDELVNIMETQEIKNMYLQGELS